MNIDRLRREIEIDEGRVEEIYLDHLGFPTFGIGHLITKKDPEYKKPVGTKISAERVNEVFGEDVEIVISDCNKLFTDFEDLPEDVQRIIANMMFNMGRTRLSKFKNFISAVESSDWKEAAEQMIDSNWYKQVTKRANRLVIRMRKVT